LLEWQQPRRKDRKHRLELEHVGRSVRTGNARHGHVPKLKESDRRGRVVNLVDQSPGGDRSAASQARWVEQCRHRIRFRRRLRLKVYDAHNQQRERDDDPLAVHSIIGTGAAFVLPPAVPVRLTISLNF